MVDGAVTSGAWLNNHEVSYVMVRISVAIVVSVLDQVDR